MTTRTATTIVMVSLLSITGCSRIKDFFEKSESPPPAQQTTFVMHDMGESLTEDQLPSEASAYIVKQDFNLDALQDLAVAEKDETGRDVISVYLRRPGDALVATYYKAAGISQQGDYRVTALISAADPGYADLIVMLAYANGKKEMVHFRSEGEDFRELERKETSPAKSP
ncbi:MAG: hypothetical protein O3A51_03455 [Verrucomicrobia bacterium]|nr:hypothetical protein [Verrucomicrobiota bacterium]